MSLGYKPIKTKRERKNKGTKQLNGGTKESSIKEIEFF
jgi:hypothetical protein